MLIDLLCDVIPVAAIEVNEPFAAGYDTGLHYYRPQTVFQNPVINCVGSLACYVRHITGLDASLYNCLLTDESRSFDGDIVQEIITSDTFDNQMETMLDEMSGIVYALIIIGAIICIAALYVSINMLV